MPGETQKNKPDRPFRSPRGTRDLYPEDVLRRRYITETWRRVALRHGFDEVDGPMFEHLDLYTVKSGEGIVSELFSFQRQGGEETYALRPEFTPTLARMYAAQAGGLPKPTRWFSIGPFFRAERPQRGRLREFLQWNVDVMGDESEIADLDVVACVAGCIEEFGLCPGDARVRLSHRGAISSVLVNAGGVAVENVDAALTLLDRREKTPPELLAEQARAIGLDLLAFDNTISTCGAGDAAGSLMHLQRKIDETELHTWCMIDPSIVRGLAYYTGTVFEVIAEGERAVAGGGRYDHLIELLGGPATPAVGFAMGDVVLANLLADKGLMPEGDDLLAALSGPMRTRPDVFVITNGDDAAEQAYTPTLARLRRGEENEGFSGKPWSGDRYAVPPLHARRTYKATRNVGKLLKEASQAHARTCAILESGEHATLKDLDTGEQREKIALDVLGREIAAKVGLAG